MAGGSAYLPLRPVAPVRPVSAFNTRMRISSPLPKSIWKLRVSPQSTHENPLFAQKTIELSDRVRRRQSKIQGVTEFVKVCADAAVAYIVGKLVDFIANEGNLLTGVRADLDSIKKELEYMQCFLEDADSKQITDARVGKLVAEIRDISYEVEDAIDTFIYSRQRRRELTENVKRNIFKPITDYEVAKQIERIKQKICDISRRRETYGIKDINKGRQEASLQKRRRFSALLEDPEVVGLQEEIKKVRELLMYGEPRRCVVSIFGMGGSGKTTLAKKVYHAVKDDFDCHALICISQQYEIRDVLMRIIKCVRGTSLEVIEKLDEVGLRTKLRDHLKERRYLVVIDDVWSMEAWDDLKDVLPDGMKESRVMLTTRNREVALHAGTSSHLHEKRLLNPNEGWELFLKTVFRVENAACPSKLQEIGEKILAKCGGLPLAILVVGSLLSRKKKTLDAWSKVLKRLYRHLTESPEDCMGILALSYWDLPAHLKPCFLYLGVFPEDYEIDPEKLIRLWIAEGFIQQRDEETMEDVAEDYLEELFDRSMVQVSRRRSDGPVVECRIHDLLRDLSISKATQNNFFTIHNVEGACSFSSTNVRRLALHRSIKGYHPTVTLRSLLNFRDSRISYSEFRQAKLLRVLRDDFMFPREPTSIKELKEFVCLRYLELNGGKGLLPSSIGDFNNLQTLVLDLSIGSLPESISNLEQLRHLEALENEVGNLQVNKLTNLQTLCLRNGKWIKDGFGNLTNLRKLIITGDIDLNEETLCDSIGKLLNLRSLALYGLVFLPQLKPSTHPCPLFEMLLTNLRKLIITGDRDLNEETLSDSIGKLLNLRSLALYGPVFLPQLKPFTHHSRLYEMLLFGAMKELPELPPNLEELTLGSTRLEAAAISKLEKLPHLKILKLCMDSCKIETMSCSDGSFPELEILFMAGIPLKEWKIEDKAMPSLKSVELNTMRFLNTETLHERIRALLKHA